MKPARGALRNNIPGYAGGGLIDGLKRAVGIAPAETMREKFARQDAERMAKQAPPVPKPVMAAPEGQTAVTSYAAGTLTGDRKKQMEDAIGKKVGGAIRGKGTGTSDEIPIMASNGEFMIKASSVKKIGIEALEALNAIGDQPDEKDSPAEAAREYGDAESSAEDKKEPKGAEKAGYKCGGAVRKMATGGLVTDEEKRKQALANGSTISTTGREIPNTPDQSAQLASQNASYIAGAQAANPPAAPVPVASPTPSAPAPAGAVRPAPIPGDGQMSYGDQMKNLGSALVSAPVAALKTIVSAPGYGMNSPAAAPAQPTPPATAAVAPPAGAVRPPAVPVAPAPVAAPTAPTVAAAPAQPAFDPLAAKAERDAQTQKDIALGNQMEATRKASEAEGYAAQDRGIDTSIAIAAKVDADRARQRAENTLSSTTDNAATRAQKAAATQTLGALDQQASQAAGNEATARRTNQADATTRREQDIRAAGQQVQAGALRANQKMAQDKFAQDSKGAAIDQQGKAQIQALQTALLAEQDPAKRQFIEDNLRAVQGKYEKAVPQKYTVYNLPDTVDANGQVVRGGQGALDAEGKPIDIRPQPKPVPKVGDVVSGHKFKGGNPADQKNWEKV